MASQYAKDLSKKIHDYVTVSTNAFMENINRAFDMFQEDENWYPYSYKRKYQDKYEANCMPVIKYMPPKFIGDFHFHNQKRFVISNTEGYTWGDGVYVSPLTSATASIMYGRCGALGWLPVPTGYRVFDATQRRGIELYQQWIQRKIELYKYLTTTVHAGYANRHLRNLFKETFYINLVIFEPDEQHRSYVRDQDVWYMVSDARDVDMPPYSNKIADCEWIILVGEEFERKDLGFISYIEHFVTNDHRNPVLSAEYKMIKCRTTDPSFMQLCLEVYEYNHNAQNPNDRRIILVVP